jgi:hypothetical protein
MLSFHVSVSDTTLLNVEILRRRFQFEASVRNIDIAIH